MDWVRDLHRRNNGTSAIFVGPRSILATFAHGFVLHVLIVVASNAGPTAGLFRLFALKTPPTFRASNQQQWIPTIISLYIYIYLYFSDGAGETANGDGRALVRERPVVPQQLLQRDVQRHVV